MTINNFNITAPPRVLAAEERAKYLSKDNLIAFGKFFLKSDFNKSESPFFHYEIANAYMDDSDLKQLAVIIARGHGKTSLTKAFILHKFCYHEVDKPPFFIAWLSSTLGKSYSNIDYISTNITINQRIVRCFGKRGGKGLSNTWTKQDLKDAFGNTLVSRSNVRSIQGETIGSIIGGVQRFNLVILDDIEGPENTKTLESRLSIKKNVTNIVYPALDERNGRLIFNGTPTHPDSLCQNILDAWRKAVSEGRENEFSWRVITYKASQPTMEGGVLWNSYIPRESLERKKQFFFDTYGNYSGYYQEYELEPQGLENRVWTRDHYIIHNAQYRWEDGQSYLTWKNKTFPVNCFLGSDPATDIDSPTSDDSVIMVIAVDELERIFVLDYTAKLAIPQLGLKDKDGKLIGEKGVVDYIFEYYDLYHCLNGTVENVAMTRGVWQDMRAEQHRLGRWDLVLKEEKPLGREKLNKIKTGLNSAFSHRRIYVRENHYKLREQIEGMGWNLAHDDVIEALFFATRNCFAPKPVKKEEFYQRTMKKVKSWVVS